jgi:hypothetical protein
MLSSRSRRRPLAIASLAIALLATGLIAGAALAKKGPRTLVTEAIADARAALKRNDYVATIAALEAATRHASEAAPLELRKVVVVSQPTQGLGVYDPIPAAIIKDGIVRLYVEVANFGSRVIDPETHEIDLRVTGSFAIENGDELGSKELGAHVVRTRTLQHVTAMGLEFKLGDQAPKGAFVVEVRVVDGVTRKEAKKKVRFVIAG